MTTLSLVLPQIGQPDTTEDVKVINGFTAIQSVINGNLDTTNLTAAVSQSAGVNASGQTIKGATNIAALQSTGSTTYTTLATPDQVSGIVLPVNGLLAVWYSAVWQESVGGAARAAIFIGANQLQVAVSGGTSVAEAGTGGVVTGGTAIALISDPAGLYGNWAGAAYTAPVTTGQAIASLPSGVGFHPGGPCHIFAAAGTYNVSVQFKASSGTVSASSRRLWVQALSFA